MAACASGHWDEARRAFFNGLVRKAVIDDVVHGDAAPIAHRVEYLRAGAKRGDNHRHLPLLAGRHIRLNTVV